MVILVARGCMLMGPSWCWAKVPFLNEEQHHNINVSLDPEVKRIQSIAETSTVTYYDNEKEEEVSVMTTPSWVLLCNGGDSFVTVTECRFDDEENELESDEEEEDEESDDEDDDEDDGHSMILSNNSLRRSVSYFKENDGGNIVMTKMIKDKKSYSRKQPIKTALFGSSTKHCSALRTLRGGAETVTPSSEFLKRLFVSAIVTLLYEAAIGHLLEFVKIVYQTSPPGTTYLHVLKTITQDKGIPGIWDGFVPWGVIQSIFKGGVFGLALAAAKSLFNPFHLSKQTLDTLASAIAGGLQGYILSPTLLLKTRVMTDHTFRRSMSLSQTCLQSFKIGCHVVTNEGIPALMKGSNVFALKRTFDWSTRFYFSHLFAALFATILGKDSLNFREKALSDFFGGTASTLSTLPLDVIVATLQDSKKAGQHVTLSHMFAQEFQEGGWDGLRDKYTRGFIARLLHVCFTTIAMKTGTQLVYDALFK